MIGRVIALGVTILSSAAAFAAEPRQPTEKWVVNFADAQCIATRNYGSAAKPIFLVLKAPAMGDVLQIGIIRSGGQDEPSQADGEIIFGDARPVKTSLLQYGDRASDKRVLIANVPTSELARLQLATTLRIKARETGFSDTRSRIPLGASTVADETFALGQMSKLMQVLDECAADLRKVWHITGSDSKSPDLKEEAKGNLAPLFNSDDYPGIAILKEQMGTVSMVLLVDEQGSVADCTTVETSGVAALDAQSCAIVKKRARFKPAIGLDGRPAKSGYRQRITWRLER